MKYNAFIHSSQSKEDAACAIIIVPENGEMFKKILPMKDCSVNKADLFGVKYIVASINDPQKEIIINTDNGYIIGMTDCDKKGNWAKKPNKYEDLISDMRSHISSKLVKLIYGGGPLMEKVKWWSQSIYRLKDGVPPGGKTPLEI